MTAVRPVNLILSLALALSAIPLDARAAAAQEAAYELWQSASDLIDEERHGQALATLRQLQLRFPGFEKMTSVQTRIAVLHEARDAGSALSIFLQALDARDEGRTDQALAALAWVATDFADSSLTDDALYLSAYMQVMDRYDYSTARQSLAELNRRFPDSAYRDSADYLDAIALEQLGETDKARTALEVLRDRHTALTLPLGFRWPVGSMLSRYWFDRADRRLAIVEARQSSASTIEKRQRQPDGRLRLAINIDGTAMTLLLSPSPLTRTTAWRDGRLDDRAPPALGVYDGVVEGLDGSWVRAVLRRDSISGVMHADGQLHRLHSSDLIGTLDYYQPRSGALPGKHLSTSPLADHLQGLDALEAPPYRRPLSRRKASVQTSVRAVPMSVVIDSRYDRYHGGEGLATALSNLNVADGIYRQFGLAITLDEVLKFEEDADPLLLAPGTLETILRRFREYRLERRTLFSDSALTYLFTGNPKTDVTLGLAWINTLCRSDGYDVGVTTPASFGDVLLTHELGHSLGALHDSDTDCRSDNSHLMWPNISERTPTRLSACSRASILPTRSRACLSNTVDLGLQARGDGDAVRFVARNRDDTLILDTMLEVETSGPEQLDWPSTCQRQTPTSAQCRLEDLGPGESRELVLPANDSPMRDGPVTARLNPLGVLELSPDDNVATSTVDGPLSTAQPSPAMDQVEDPGSIDIAAQTRSGGGGGWGVELGALLTLLTVLRWPPARALPGRRSPRWWSDRQERRHPAR